MNQRRINKLQVLMSQSDMRKLAEETIKALKLSQNQEMIVRLMLTTTFIDGLNIGLDLGKERASKKKEEVN